MVVDDEESRHFYGHHSISGHKNNTRVLDSKLIGERLDAIGGSIRNSEPTSNTYTHDFLYDTIILKILPEV